MDTSVLDSDHDGSDGFVTTFAVCNLPFTNWSPHTVAIWGHIFPTAEHAFQYRKHADSSPRLAAKILRAQCPDDAKQLAWSKPIDTHAWDNQRESVMHQIISAKITQHPSVRIALAGTDRRAIIQKTADNDLFWGAGKNGRGKNTMGKIWVALRSTLLSN